MINKLVWDSNFFQFNVGKIELLTDTDLDFNDISRRLNESDYKLIYLFVSPSYDKINNEIRNVGATLVDQKVTYRYSLTQKLLGNDFKDIFTFNNISPKLIDLALQSGIYSRFRHDKKIPRSKFNEMYTIWITKSVENENIIVFGHNNDNKELDGFATLSIKSNHGKIELIAVDKNQRGDGVGSKLINCILQYAKNNRLSFIDVSTQKNNTSACNFYLKNNFKLLDEVNIYHLWSTK